MLPPHRAGHRSPRPSPDGRDTLAGEALSGSEAGDLEALERLDSITRRLRRECPWDREQDARSIVPHTVEEAYELADAAAAGDPKGLLDELGDVLFQVLFLALLLEEAGEGDLAQVAEGAAEKLIRRHPHVFGEAEAASSGEVLRSWDRIKREQEGRAGTFGDVPENLPALLLARKLQRRAASAGHDAGGAEGALGRLEDAVGRLARLAATGASAAPTAEPGDRDLVERELGELLFSAVELARELRVDPELALRSFSRRFRARVESKYDPED